MVDRLQISMALEGEKVLLVVLGRGDAAGDPEIEQAVATAVKAGKPLRAADSDSSRVPVFFRQAMF
jgi:hypothetical protein